MSFHNTFTDQPGDIISNLKAEATLIGVNPNPFQEGEYVVTTWVDEE